MAIPGLDFISLGTSDKHKHKHKPCSILNTKNQGRRQPTALAEWGQASSTSSTCNTHYCLSYVFTGITNAHDPVAPGGLSC